MLKARDIMTREVLTVPLGASVSEVARVLAERRINGVPVVDDKGSLMGIITQTDLVKRSRDMELPPAVNILDFHLFLETPGEFKRRLEKMLSDRVEDVMTTEVVTIPAKTPVADIAALMDRQKVHTLPVIERGKLVGVVGKIDLIRALAQQAAE